VRVCNTIYLLELYSFYIGHDVSVRDDVIDLIDKLDIVRIIHTLCSCVRLRICVGNAASDVITTSDSQRIVEWCKVSICFWERLDDAVCGRDADDVRFSFNHVHEHALWDADDDALTDNDEDDDANELEHEITDAYGLIDGYAHAHAV
jgi:hypothetical protein